jgi:capsular polysaccharide biosynthesis protein
MLHHSIDTGQLLQATQAQVASQSDVLNVVVRLNDAHDAALLATAMADSFVAWDSRRRSQAAASKLAGLERSVQQYSSDYADATLKLQRLGALSGLTAQQKAQSDALARRQVDDQQMIQDIQKTADGLRLRQAGSSNVQVLQEATVPIAPIDTHASRTVLIAAVLALLVLSGVAVLADLLETVGRRHTRTDEKSASQGASS